MQQKFLNFSVDGQNIRTPHQKVVADSRNYLLARFSFDEVWQGLTKTAVFQGADGRVYHMLLEGDCCMVPAEVIKPTRFTVSVFGGDRLTTDRAVVEVTASGMLDGITPPVPTPDIYTQLTETVALERQIAQSAAVTATEKAELCAEAAKSTDEILETVIAANEIAAGAVECAQKAGEQAAKAELAADTAATHAAYAEQKTDTAVSAAHSASNAATQAANNAAAAEDSAVAAAESARLSQLAEQRYVPKLLKTITVQEATTSIKTTFERPLKELFVVFRGYLNTDAVVNNCILASRCDGGGQYFFYMPLLTFSQSEPAVFIYHAREVAERYWETAYPTTILSSAMQGASASAGDMRTSFSFRPSVISRYVSDLEFFVFNHAYAFRPGATLEIWGVEAE